MDALFNNKNCLDDLDDNFLNKFDNLDYEEKQVDPRIDMSKFEQPTNDSYSFDYFQKDLGNFQLKLFNF
jgi:hypothetical protein